MAEGNLVQIILRAKDELSRELGKTEGALGSLGTKLFELGRTLAIPTIAAGALAASLTLIVKRAADVGDSLLKASDQTGITVEQLSALNFAGVQSDVTLTDLAHAVKFMSVNMAEAIQKTGEARDVFTVGLGVSLQQLNDVSGDSAKAFELIATNLVTVTNATNRANLQTKIFGRSSQELTQFIDDLAQRKLKGFEEAAKKAGVVIGRDFAVAADQFNDNIAKMGIILDVLMVKIAGPVIKAFNDLAVVMGLVSETPLQASLTAIDHALGKIPGQINRLKMKSFLPEMFEGGEIAVKEAQDLMLAQRKLEEVRNQLLNPPAQPKAPGREGTLPSDEAKKAAEEFQKAVESLIKSLKQENDQFQQQIILMQQGELAAQKFGLQAKLMLLPKGTLSAEQTRVIDVLITKQLALGQSARAAEVEQARLKKILDAITDETTPAFFVDPDSPEFQEKVAKIVAFQRDAQHELLGLQNSITDVFLTNKEREITAAQQWGDAMTFQLESVIAKYKTDFPEVAALAEEQLARIPAAVAEKLNTTEETIRDVLGGVGDGISTMIQGIVLGTQTLQEAFARSAQSIGLSLVDKIINRALDPILDKLAQVLTKLSGTLVSAAIGGLTRGLGGGDYGLAELAAQGGIFKGGLRPIHGYAGGGVVRSPQLAWIGEGSSDEAVIPLKGGKVPVDMRGGGMPEVKVIINGSITPNPGIDPARVIEIVTSDYRADGRTRRMMRG